MSAENENTPVDGCPDEASNNNNNNNTSEEEQQQQQQAHEHEENDSSCCSSSSDGSDPCKTRGVKFQPDESLCSYHGDAVMDQIDSRRDIWYQHADLTHIKRKAMMVSKEAHRYGFGSLLTNTYGNACEETQEALNTWTRNANSRRGLERWINDEYSAKRSDIRRRTIQSVLRAQQKMKQENIVDVEYGMKVISRLSEAFSQDSRTFARCMGIADEAAVRAMEEAVALKTDKLSAPSAAHGAAGDVPPVKPVPSTSPVSSTVGGALPPQRVGYSPSPRTVIPGMPLHSHHGVVGPASSRGSRMIAPSPARKSLGLSGTGAGDFRNFV